MIFVLIAEAFILLGMNLDTYKHLPLTDDSWYSNHQILVAFILLLLMVYTGEEKGKILLLLYIILIFFSLVILNYSKYSWSVKPISFEDVGVQLYTGLLGIILLIIVIVPNKKPNVRPRGQAL